MSPLSHKLADTVFACQSDVRILTRQVAAEGFSSDEADFEDLGRNADLYLYIFNQDQDDRTIGRSKLSVLS